MQKNRIWRKAALLVCLFALGFVSLTYYNREINSCMGVDILAADVAEDITFTQVDLSGKILLDGYPAATDTDTNTIYISQNITEDTKYTDLKGVFSTVDDTVKLYFDEDITTADIYSTAQKGCGFKMYAVENNETWVQYNVVITNLPVINMYGEVTDVKVAGEFDATGDRDIYTGVISVWDSAYEGTKTYSAKNSYAQWHQRGNSTFWLPKKSWKITFKDAKGNNRDMDFLGLEADDDWVLNAVARDDTLLREKTVMDLWNSGIAVEEYNHNMSTGKYVELINDGEYMGVYLLQRRLDAKYLQLEDDVQLAKGGKGDILYETVNTTDQQATLALLEGLRTGENLEYLDLDNWIDTSLLVDAFYMADNASRYNTYYVIENLYTTPHISLVLWDTDFSFGIGYSNGFVYQPHLVDVHRRNRNELYQLAEIYPYLYDRMSQRWAQLREGPLSTENVIATLTENFEHLNHSGAFIRDKGRWADDYGGSDTFESMCQYVTLRMEYLDNCYARGEIIRETGDVVPEK